MQHALLPLHSPLENTPHKAGVERDGLVAALIATVQMAAERGGAAKLDGAQHVEMEPR